MSRSAETPEDTQILFCPFCRDGFEGLTECPEHELTLLPIDRLPRQRRRSSNEVSFFVDPGLGRGTVLLGAALVLIGFFLPFASARAVRASALGVAIDGANNLWLTPVAAVAMLWVLWRRRTAATMRAARLAVLGLALAGGLPLIYTSRRVGLVADVYATEVEWLSGLWVMTAGLVVAALGSLRLGRAAESGDD